MLHAWIIGLFTCGSCSGRVGHIYIYIHIFSNPVVDRIWKCRKITSKMGRLWNLS